MPIKKKWFDMILSGVKKEEYRKISPYYASRLKGCTHIKFINGYGDSRPRFTIEVRYVDKDFGNPEWGAEPETDYYVIGLGAITTTGI